MMSFRVILLLVVLFSGCGNVKSNKDDCSEWVTSHGYVKGNTKNRYIHYTVNGKEYKSRFVLTFYGEIDGEIFELKYCKLNPRKVNINYYKPIFLDEERTAFFKGKIKRVFMYNIFPSKYRVTYICNVQGAIIEKSQEIPTDYKKIYPTLEEGSFFEVECLVSNARRNFIHLDKPLNH